MKATHVNFFTVTYLQLGPFGENSLFVIAKEKMQSIVLASFASKQLIISSSLACTGIPISFRIFHSLCDPHSQRLWHSQ